MPGLPRGVGRTTIAQQPRNPPNPRTATDDEVDLRSSQLREPGELRSRGVLTEEEFNQQQSWILNQ
jgi:hypothetical protein